MRFEIKDIRYGVWLSEKQHNRLIRIGNIWLYKYHEKEQSYCFQIPNEFDYHDIPNALCGKKDIQTFNPKRLLVLQME